MRHLASPLGCLAALVLTHGAPAADPARTDALVPGTRFHATGEIRCGLSGGEPAGRCRFGVVRHGRGRAEVTVFRPDGSVRTIAFDHGVPVGVAVTFSRHDDVFTVGIGPELYEIPDAVISGG